MSPTESAYAVEPFSPFSRINSEILLRILTNLSEDADLMSASLVNKTFAQQASKVLYNAIYLPDIMSGQEIINFSKNNFRCLTRAIWIPPSLAKTKVIWTALRNLGELNKVTIYDCAKCMTPNVMATNLAVLPQLHSLTLEDVFMEQVLEVLDVVRQLSDLIIAAMKVRACAPTRRNVELLWTASERTNLKRLELSGVSTSAPDRDLMCFSKRLPSSLKILAWNSHNYKTSEAQIDSTSRPWPLSALPLRISALHIGLTGPAPPGLFEDFRQNLSRFNCLSRLGIYFASSLPVVDMFEGIYAQARRLDRVQMWFDESSRNLDAIRIIEYIGFFAQRANLVEIFLPRSALGTQADTIYVSHLCLQGFHM